MNLRNSRWWYDWTYSDKVSEIVLLSLKDWPCFLCNCLILISCFDSFFQEWKIPDMGKEGYVEDKATGKVLGIINNDTVSGTKVLLMEKIKPITDGQKWSRLSVLSPGFLQRFALINSYSGKALTVHPDTKITIESKLLRIQKVNDSMVIIATMFHKKINQI